MGEKRSWTFLINVMNSGHRGEVAISIMFPNIQIRDFFSKFTHFFKGFTFKSVGTCTFSRKIINPDQIGRRLRNIFTKIENMKKLIPD